MQIHPLLYPLSTSCNLSCSYCFHRNKIQDNFKKQMSIQIYERFLDEFLKVNSNNGKLEIIWHGGEPMLRGMKFYQQATDIINRYKSNGIKIVQSMQTNGLLIDKNWLSFFKENNFSIGLSIDGPKDVHDLFRRTKKGHGSFDNVMFALSLFREFNIPVGQVSVIHSGNVRYPKKMFDFFKSNNMKKIQLSPCIEKSDTKLDTFSITPKQFAGFICTLYDLWLEEDDPNMSIGYIDDIVDTFLGSNCYNCFLSDQCNNFIAVDWNGDILPCENLFGTKVIFGNIMNSSLEEILSSPIRQKYYSKISSKRESICGQCEWFDLCKGGCPYQWESLEIGKTSLCQANKIIFEYIGSSIHKIYTECSHIKSK